MRRTLLLALLVLFPLALFLLWPQIVRRLTTAELALAVVRQPREEVLILGFVKHADAPPFSMQTLRIEEPGKEPYRRRVSLDADRRMELTLNEPVQGNYRASLLLARSRGSESSGEAWLATPQLTIDADRTRAGEVRARELNHARLVAVAAGCAASWAVLLGLCIGAWRRSRSLRGRKNGTPDEFNRG